MVTRNASPVLVKKQSEGVLFSKTACMSRRGDRDSVVGIATRYGLDGPGIESGGGRRDLPHLSTHPASCTMGTGSFLGVKLLGRGVEHPPPFNAGVKERVELYLYSPSGPL